MTREEFYHFLKMNGGLIIAHRKMAGPVYQYGCACDEGWFELIAGLIRELIDAGWTREISQIKEKFGGLRFYAEGLPDNGMDIIIKYMKRSFEICECCGSTDKVKLCGYRWLKTLCEECERTWLDRQYPIKV